MELRFCIYKPIKKWGSVTVSFEHSRNTKSTVYQQNFVTSLNQSITRLIIEFYTTEVKWKITLKYFLDQRILLNTQKILKAHSYVWLGQWFSNFFKAGALKSS